jgi:hypothetical protein
MKLAQSALAFCFAAERRLNLAVGFQPAEWRQRNSASRQRRLNVCAFQPSLTLREINLTLTVG